MQAQDEVFFYALSDDLFEEIIADRHLQFGAPDYWRNLADVVFLMYHTAKTFSDLGKNVLLDGMLLERPEFAPHYETVKGILKDNPLEIVEVYCPAEICRQRNLARGDREEYQSQEQLARMAKDVAYSLRLDTEHMSPEECAEAILKRFF